MLNNGHTARIATEEHRDGEHGGNEREHADRLATTALTRLQKSTLRLAFSYYGRFAELDSRLTQLHGTLRNHRRSAELTDAIEAVIATITRLEAEQQHRAEDAAFEAMAELADRVPWPESRGNEAWRLRQRLGNRKNRGALLPMIEECASLVGACISMAPAQSAPAVPADGVGTTVQTLERMLERLEGPADLGRTLLEVRKRLLGIAGQAELLAVLDEIAALLSEHLRRTDDAAPDPHAHAWSEPLVQLLERLSFPRELAPELAAVKGALGACRGGETDSALVARAANLIAELQRRLQRDLDGVSAYLRQTMLRLQELHAHMMLSHRARKDALADSRRVSELVEQHVEGIRVSVDEASSLDDLRHTIDVHLESISTDLLAMVEAERARNEEAERAVTTLNTQLQDLESETLQLRETLKEVHAKAVQDALTGIANRLGYEERMRQEHARWNRHGRPLSLVVFDIDFFKAINDQYGHQAGDRVLVTVAEQMSSQIRQSDFFARYGGEEFVLLLPETALDEARALADKLRQDIERCRFRYADAPVPVTISCGVAEFRAGDEPQAVFERADAALYNAKRSGRNRCCTDAEPDAA